ncbi:unnamed protein product [Adineta ricciae]|uniref:WD repeat-containing protein on Y chromosome n=1 Tax=Adineta ricciae TaxID=249248 RepID=A0A813TN95_ADIRI|nr:unnamed protein product [Adineta ricciae]
MANPSNSIARVTQENDGVHSSPAEFVDTPSSKPYKALQTLQNAQIGVRLSNRLLIQAVDEYLRYLQNEKKEQYVKSNEFSNGIDELKTRCTPLSLTTETSLGQTVEDMVTFEFVEKVRKSFTEADTDNTGYLDVSEFTAFMRQTYSDMTDREAQIIFMKFQFFPGLSRAGVALDEIDYTYGRCISITRNGLVSHWSTSLKLIRESTIQSNQQKKQTLPLWITCMCVLPDMNYFVIATTERNVIFYDVNSHLYTGSIMINYFPASLTTISYRMNIKDSFQSALFCGDSLGNLFVFQAKDQHKPMFHISDRTYQMQTGSMRYFSFPRVVNNEYLTVSVINFCNLHYDWIVQVKWISDLDLFVSCALTSRRSLYIGDLHKKTEKYAMAKKGFGAFDYCTGYRSIVTGGNDGVIRFWDPFVTERAAAILRGHYSSITHLVVDNQDAHVISIDKGKNIIVWDIQTLRMIQRISHTNLELPSQDLTVCYLNPTQQNLIIGNKKLLSLSHTNESYAHNERTSHLYAITQVLYNSLFDVLISADEHSTINIWNVVTGEKIMHILNAHVTQYDEYNEHAIEITAMCFDEAKRRLITGAHDGSLALWNFNNGHNLYRINSNGVHAKEITALLHENERLFVAGWSKRIRVFHLGKSVVIRQVDEFRSLHTDDILSMSIVMNILATGNNCIFIYRLSLFKHAASYDGDIILWTIETGMPFMRLNASEDVKPKLISLSWLYKQTYPRKPNLNLQSQSSTISSDYHLDQLLFLHTREISPLTATLITTGSMGWVWWWSIHVIGSLIAVFNGARRPQEHVLAVCLDEKCNILFTCDTAGYVALWFIGDYACKPLDSKEKQSKLLEDKSRILTKFSSSKHPTTIDIQEMKNQSEQKLRDHMGTPRIAALNQDSASFLMSTVVYPQLLTAYRAHLRPITSICYANDREIVITSSIDCTIRLFTLTGRYIGFMGQSVSWGPLSSTISLKDLPKRLPEDIRRKGSAATLETLRGDIGKRWKLLKHTVVAWTSLPIFQYFYHNNRPEIHQLTNPSQEVPNPSNEFADSVKLSAQKQETTVTKEWTRRRERIHRLIGLDRLDAVQITKKPSIESMLKLQRDNFGVTMPVLGQFTRNYMHHRPRSDFERVKIYGGKAIIYSLLPLAVSSDVLPEMALGVNDTQNKLSTEYFDIDIRQLEEKKEGEKSLMDDLNDKLFRLKKKQICSSQKNNLL